MSRIQEQSGAQVLSIWHSFEGTQTQRDHTNCSTEQCKANDISVASTKSFHVDEECSCDFTGSDTRVLEQLIASGSIPVVKLEEKNEVVTVAATESLEPDVEFIAISHA